MYSPEQQALLTLQKHYNDIRALKRAYVTHTAHAKLAEIEKALSALNTSCQALDAQAHALQRNIVASQDEIEAATAKIEIDRQELNRTSDSRVTQALSKDIDAHTRRIDKLEFNEISLLEQADELSAKRAACQEKIDQLSAARDKTQQGLASIKEQATEKITQLKSERAQLIAQLPHEWAQLYARVSQQKEGVIVGEFINQTCSICRVKLATTQIDEILEHSGDVTICPSCKRIIVVA